MTQPFAMIESAVMEVIVANMPEAEDLIGGDLSYDGSEDFYILLGLVTGSTDAIYGSWTLDIEVFDTAYGQAMTRALDVEALLLKPGGHRTSIMRIDSVAQNEVPATRPWDDDSTYRIGASYVFTARRSG